MLTLLRGRTFRTIDAAVLFLLAAIAGTSLPMTSRLNASSHVRRRPLDGEWCPAVWAPSCVADDAIRLLGEFNNEETTTTDIALFSWFWYRWFIGVFPYDRSIRDPDHCIYSPYRES